MKTEKPEENSTPESCDEATMRLRVKPPRGGLKVRTGLQAGEASKSMHDMQMTPIRALRG